MKVAGLFIPLLIMWHYMRCLVRPDVCLVFCALLAGCENSTRPDDGPALRSALVAANPLNTLSATVTVTAVNADSVFVRFWRPGEPPRRTPAFPFLGDSVVRVPLLALDTASSYMVETNLVAGGSAVAADTGAVTSGSLPAWIPAIGTIGTDTTPGFLALSLPSGPVIINNEGKVVWYRDFPGGVLNSFQAHRNGVYTILGTADVTPRFHVLNNLGEETGVIECKNGFKTRFHDFMVAEGGDYWILCDDTRTLDLSGLGGDPAAQVTATVVQHVALDGTVLFEWNAFDHFQITDLPASDRTGPSVNFTHGNGIDLDTDGNLLLSFRSLSEVTKVNISNGQVMWRLGGLANQFTFINNTKAAFDRQHGVRQAGVGIIQMLDNGLGAPSRYVTFEIDATAHTATMLHEFIESPTTYAPVGGGTQHFTNGHSVVTFGQAGVVVEVDQAGAKVWELTGVTGLYVFRVQRIQSLYTPGLGETYR
jgi:hypothetical protein